MLVVFLLILVNIGILNGEHSFSERLEERLILRALPGKKLLGHFQFDIHHGASPEDIGHNYRYFPKSIGEVLRRTRVDEVHFSLTSGRWYNNKWGHSYSPVSKGAELWGVFRDGTTIMDQWSYLLEQLSAVYPCFFFNVNFL